MGKPPEGGLLVATFLILCLVGSGAQLNPEYGCPPQEKILPCRCSTRDMEYQIWCSHSELPKVLEGLEAVSHYVTRPVDELILENNNLLSLPGRAFASLRVMRLMLRNNRLERVSSGWLEGLHDSLLELFMVEPDLRSLPVDSLDNLQGLEAITLQSKSMKRLPRFSGLTKLRYLQVNSPALLELIPRNFRHLPSLEQLHVFGSQKLVRLEAGILRDLPRLSLVNISECGINWIHPRAMIELPELKEISLVGNSILDAAMIGRVGMDLPILSTIRLDRNRISRLGEASFVDLPMLSRLYLSRNHISEIFPGAFQRLPMLRIIDLNHNIVHRIHPEFFPERTGSGLEEMWLINNDLSHVSELRAVLEALPRLKFLDVSYNQLVEIPFGAIRGHLTLERLHLDHNRLSFLQRETFSSMPALRELRLRNNSLSNSLEGSFWNLPALKGLDLSENYFRLVEPHLLANLPNLRRLDISRNAIELIEPESFLNTPALEHINISGNVLSVLHPLTFRHLTNLYELDVGWNRLTEVVPGLPRNIEHLHMSMNRIVLLPRTTSADLALPALRSLDISANGIERLPPGFLSRLSNLRKLNCGYNSLMLLENGVFDGLSKLEQLNLMNNRLVSLHGSILKNLRSLMDLNLIGNRLEVIESDVFQDSSRLQRLDLSENNLARIPHAMFANTRELRELYASNNFLTELPGSLHLLTALQVLDLSFNQLSSLSPKTLSSLTSLLELKLVKNKIRELKEGAFNRLPRLALIDLENNDLRMVERNSIRALPELQALRLGKNHLQMIPSGAFSELPLLQSAELQENNLQRIASNAFINVPHLLFLNLSYNMLPDLEYVGLESLKSLEVLDLSNNRLSRIASESLAAMEWLVELKMDNNRICTIHGSPFDDMPRLRVLSLRNNRMASVSENAFKRLRSNIAILDIDGNPLSCSCGMLWLRGWLQQAASDGPRCADGSLFKEIRLSRQDCLRERRMESVLPGCEAEVIKASSSSASSSLFGTSQAMSSWMNLKTPTSLPPLPNESDYFYDEYVDYPYQNLNNSSTPNLSTSATTLSSVDLTFSSQAQPDSSQISEATTPFSEKKRNETVPGKNTLIPPSPSSSGFTFFGVPLPSLNFNLWRNSGRRADRKSDPFERPARGHYRLFPPTEPEIHRGGFIPLPRGQGGFVPIIDPRLTYRRKLTNGTSRNPNVNVTAHRIQEERKSTKNTKGSLEKVEKASSVESKGQMEIKLREELLGAKNNASIVSMSKDFVKMSSNETKDINVMSVTEDDSSQQVTQESVVFTETFEDDGLEESTEETKMIDDSHEIASKIVWTTPKSVMKEMLKSVSKETMTASVEVLTSKKKNSFWDFDDRFTSKGSIVPTTTLTSSEDTTIDDIYTTTVTTIQPEDTNTTPYVTQNMDASALSALLVPGGQVPILNGQDSASNSNNGQRPPGRSTITKIPSPNFNPIAEQYHNEKGKSLIETAGMNEEKYWKKENVSRRENVSATTLDKNVEIIEDNPFNWYFQHYNDTNLEPFVGIVYGGVSGISICQWILLSAQAYLVFHNFQ